MEKWKNEGRTEGTSEGIKERIIEWWYGCMEVGDNDKVKLSWKMEWRTMEWVCFEGFGPMWPSDAKSGRQTFFSFRFYTGFQKVLGFKLLGFNKILKKYSVRYSVGLFYKKSTRLGKSTRCFVTRLWKSTRLRLLGFSVTE